ncbi:hypothetical protein K4569_01810 [Bacillus bingmayongensis]|nr:hypothetical protein [Bacillus bingmayongensis]
MGISKNLMNDIWYGPKRNPSEIDNLRELLTKISTEKNCILLINELLKVGDFSVKELLVQLLNSTKEENVLNLSIRLFCSIATHDDLLGIKKMNFLSGASENSVATFASCAIDTMSYQVIPYLLALLEEWEDTEVEDGIRNSLEVVLNYSEVCGENAAVDDI